MERLIISFMLGLMDSDAAKVLTPLGWLLSSTWTKMAVVGEAGVTLTNPGEDGEAGLDRDLRAIWEMKGERRRPETDLLEDSVSTDLLRLSPDTTFRDFSPDKGGVLGELGLGDLIGLLTGEETWKNPPSNM